MVFKLWIDDIRTPPSDEWMWIKSVNKAKMVIKAVVEYDKNPIEIISIDHDAGDYFNDGGDYIRLLDFIESQFGNHQWTFHIHSANPVGVQNMRRIIQRNGWNEIM